MLNKNRKELIEIALKEGGVTIDWAMDIYEHRSSASRALSEMAEEGLLAKRQAPAVSKYDYIWTVTDKSAKLCE